MPGGERADGVRRDGRGSWVKPRKNCWREWRGEGRKENTKNLALERCAVLVRGETVAGRGLRPGAVRLGHVAEKINGDWHDGRDRRIPAWAAGVNGEGSGGEVGVTESMWNLHGA